MFTPHTGRWLSRDPAAYSLGPDRYIYVQNNPVNLVNPSGNSANSFEPVGQRIKKTTGASESDLPQAAADAKFSPRRSVKWPIFPIDRIENQYPCCYGSTSVHCAYAIGPFDCTSVFEAAELARASQRSFSDDLNNDQQDAYRHCVWSCLVTVRIGAVQAKKALDLYEKCNSENDDAECKDLWNNAIGRSIATQIGQNTGADTTAACEGACFGGAKNGNLQLTEKCPPGPENFPDQQA